MDYLWPTNLNILCNFGFIIFWAVWIQFYSGWCLLSNYSVDNAYNMCFFCLFVAFYFGYLFQDLHCIWLIIIWELIFGHFIRGCILCSFSFRSLSWNCGCVLLLLFVVISVLGYCLAWGMLSYWGGSVIGNLLCCCGIVLLLFGYFSLSSESLGRLLSAHIWSFGSVFLFFGVHVLGNHSVGSSFISLCTSNLLLCFSVLVCCSGFMFWELCFGIVIVWVYGWLMLGMFCVKIYFGCVLCFLVLIDYCVGV